MVDTEAPAPVFCPERDRLASEFMIAFDAHCSTVRAVLASAARPSSEFAALLEENRKAYEASEAARNALAEHRREHGC